MSAAGKSKNARLNIVTEPNDDITVCASGDYVTTVEELLEKAGIDMEGWVIVEQQANAYPCTMKLKREKEEIPFSYQQHQVKVRLKPKVAPRIQRSIEHLVGKWGSKRPAVARPARAVCRDRFLAVLSLYDCHFGKLAWGQEVGDGDQDNYDTEIASQVYLHAVQDLLTMIGQYHIDKIIFPIGNDFFHVDNWDGMTTRGTSVGVPEERSRGDDRFSKVFEAGIEAVRMAIQYCREIADVECVWIPGNHDRATSYYLCRVLAAYFENDEAIQFDIGPKSRKDLVYGKNLIRFTHGDVVPSKLKWLPLSLATEQPRKWGEAECVEVHVGHFHAKQEVLFMALEEHQGVRIRVLPSLSGTDTWHYQNLYVKSRRAAELLLYSATDGYRGQFSTNVRP